MNELKEEPLRRQRDQLRGYCSHLGGKEVGGCRTLTGKKTGLDGLHTGSEEKEMSRAHRLLAIGLIFGSASHWRKDNGRWMGTLVMRNEDSWTCWVSGTTVSAKWRCQVKQLNKWVWGPKRRDLSLRNKSLILSEKMAKLYGAQAWDCRRMT